MFPPIFLVVLVCACAVSAATEKDWETDWSESEEVVTTYGRGPIPLPYEYGYVDSVDNEDLDDNAILGVWENDVETEMEMPNGTIIVVKNKSSGPKVSEGALLFLTGPVSTILMPSFYTVVCLISLPINIYAMVTFSLKIRPKKPAVIYMLNLACADLLFAALLPFKIIYHFSGNNWVFGPFMCRVVTAAFYWNMYCSVLLIACISVDRLLAIVYPINSLTWRTQWNSIIACAAMWILSLAGTVPLVLSDQTYYLRQLNIITCHDALPVHKVIWNYRIYFTVLSCVLFFLPLLVTLVSYARVICALSRIPKGAKGDTGSKRRRNRAVVMSVTVLVIFVLCFTPTNCLLLVHYLQYTADLKNIEDTPVGSHAAYLIFMCLGSLNCLLDPLFYYFGSSQCQKQLASTMSCSQTSSDPSRSNAQNQPKLQNRH